MAVRFVMGVGAISYGLKEFYKVRQKSIVRQLIQDRNLRVIPSDEECHVSCFGIRYIFKRSALKVHDPSGKVLAEVSVSKNLTSSDYVERCRVNDDMKEVASYFRKCIKSANATECVRSLNENSTKWYEAHPFQI